MSHAKSLTKLVAEARHLRDHLLHVEGQDSAKLVEALQPFDTTEMAAQASAEEVRSLNATFQAAYDSALGSVDGYTLNEVLKGRSPHIRRPSLAGSVVLTAIGICLVITAFHFSYWSNRTTFVLSEAEKFVQFDHFQSVMKLIELENYFDKTEQSPASPDLEPQLVYLEGISALKYHYHEEATLPGKMLELNGNINPVGQQWTAMWRSYCAGLGPDRLSASQGWLSWIAHCAKPRQGTQQASGVAYLSADTKIAALTPSDSGVSLFQEKIAEIAQLQQATMVNAKRIPNGDYVRSQYFVGSMMQTLKELLNVVHLWALPIIYGALGSIVYCMWRVLNPNVAAYGFLYCLMRTAFAGLAALTLSMLLVPSNVLTIGVDLNRPLIYLLSFIFGYSIEAFVSTLNLLNTYLSTNLTPKPRRATGSG
ncbi:hypothetical protein [Actibacterium sp. 188UL27-1]|uniref:hypothetical protein n=1 Tax=Actibacterium sp. 188UL27-1 TaxID=2786961 RepID=UPI001957B318|nr:hypothetical protein [Actibacterium sp. 188UL27-1]MBM7066975.1 hypothetical protein [Actibacterium sp. 188UL27-1]